MIDIHSHILSGVDDGSASMKESLQLLSLIVLAALLAGAVIAGVATKIFITPVYSATSTMLVLTKETTLSSLADLQIGSQLTKDYNILITSRTVLQDVVDELNLDMSYKELKGCIKACVYRECACNRISLYE